MALILDSDLVKIKNSSIACVFVLYYPELGSLNKLNRLSELGYEVIAVINAISPDALERIAGKNHIHVISNDQNIGLASALNQGLAYSFAKAEIEFVALFDQDSEFPIDLPRQLSEELFDLGSNTACIGPMLLDIKAQGSAYHLHNSGQVKTIPTSGTVVSREAYLRVGPMLDSLFIDSIDHEWCFRAAHQGLKIAISRKVMMTHDMGDLGMNWRGHYKPVYKNPIRHFYIIRNSIYLTKLRYIPLSWRLIEAFKILRRVIVYVWVSNDRIKTLKLIAKAIIDGFLGRLGPLHEIDV